MVSIIKNQILKHLSKFTKNLSLDKIQLSTLRGHCELRHLELDEQVLTELLELPTWLCLTRAVCNYLTLKIHWTKLKYVPIHLCLDEVLVEVETCEQLRPPSNSKPSYSSGGRYGFSDRVVDGMKVVVNSVVVNFQSASFVASFQLSRVVLDSRTPRWDPGDLRLCRIKGPDQLLLFRQLQWQMMRLEAHARGAHAGAPLRLITNGARCRIVLKKRLADCSLVASRLVLVLDELLWALTDAQLVAALHLGHSLAALVRKAAAQGRRHRAASATLPTPDYFSSSSGPPPSSQRGGSGGGGGGSGAPKSPLVEFFRQHDVLETSYHLFCTRIDLHLCDDMDPKETRSSWGPLQGGAALQVLLEKLLIDYYPFHGAASSRSQWLKYSEPSCGRQAWVQQMLSQWSERKPSSGSTPGSSGSPTSSAPPARDWRTLMSSCLLVRLEEFSMQQVCMAGRSERRPFLASEGATVLLPGEALHLELTHYYARASPATSPVTSNGHAPVGSPGSGKSSLASSSWVGGGSSVPESHLFVYLGPTALRLDLPTVLWAHAFLHSVHKCTAHLSCANGASPLAVRVEMILPKVGIPQFERERPLWPEEGPEECQELRLGCSRAVATNWRPADRGACLEALGRGPLFFETTSFPWRPSGGGGGSVRDPPPVHACFLQEQTSGSEGGGVHRGCGGGEAAQLWSVQLDPCWAEFVDRPGSSRPRAFVEPLPLTLWLGAPTQGGSRVPLLLYVPAPLRLQLGRRECAFLLRLARSAAIVQEQTAIDRQAIMGPSGQALPSVSVTAMWPHVEVTLLLPPSSATAAGVPGGGCPSDASERPSSSTTTSEADEVPLRGGMAADDSPDQPLLQPPLPPLVPHGGGEATRGPGNQPWALRKGLASFVAGIDAVLAKGAADGELESVADDDSVSLRSDLSSDSDQLLLATGVLDEVLNRSGTAEVGQDAAELLTMDQPSGGAQGVSVEWRHCVGGGGSGRPCVCVRLHDLQLVGWAGADGAALLLQSQHLALEERHTAAAMASGGGGGSSSGGDARGGGGVEEECCLLSVRWESPVPAACCPPALVEGEGSPSGRLRALVRGLCVRLSTEALAGLAQLAQVEPPPPRALPVRLLLHGLSVTLLDEPASSGSPGEQNGGLLLKVPQCLVDRTPSGAVYVLPTGCKSLAEAVQQLLWRSEERPAPPSGLAGPASAGQPDLSGLVEENERLRQRLSQLHALQRDNRMLREQVSELENSSASERRQLEEQRAELNRLEGEKHSLLATLQLLQEELSRLERASASSGCDPFCGASNS